MTDHTAIRSWNLESDLPNYLIGREVVSADLDTGTLALSDGTRLVFDKDNYDCCSEIELTSLAAGPGLITGVRVEDNEEETGGEGAYRAWIYVITEAGEFNIAEADGDASNGYYLHGFALGVTVHLPEED
jgi:hypothetical protein